MEPNVEAWEKPPQVAPPILCDAAVLANEAIGEDLWRMRLEAPQLVTTIQAGQFVEVKVPADAAQLLRLPLSFSHADKASGMLELVYAVVGEGTRALSRVLAGEKLSLIGPLGHGWRLPACLGRTVLVGGGVGVPPVIAAARDLAAAGRSFDVIVGARSASRLWGEQDAQALGASRVMVCTDDGTAGHHGLVTDPLREALVAAATTANNEEKIAQVCACGPEPMMAAVARLCAELDVPCQVSVERMMSCGFGACATCNVALTAGGYASACKDGPVFDARKVAW